MAGTGATLKQVHKYMLVVPWEMGLTEAEPGSLH